MFGALGFIFITVWLILDYSAREVYSAHTRRGEIIGRVFAVVGFSFLAIQFLQWAKVI